MFGRSFLVVLFFIWTSFLYSQNHEWERTNPGGGGAFSTIGAGPTGIIIAGSDLSGAYRSLNSGQSWDVIGASRGLTITHVSGIGFDPIDGDIIFIGTEDGIFRSDNGGESVSKVLNDGYITDIEISISNHQIGYSSHHPWTDSLDGSIFKTINNGLSWEKISSDIPYGHRILKIIIDPNNSDILWFLSGEGRFGCGPAEIWKSEDGGEHWMIQAEDLGAILDIAIEKGENPSLFITTMFAGCEEEYYWINLYGSLYRSTDGGNNWTELSDKTGMIFPGDTDGNIRLIDPREPYPWNEIAGTWETNDYGNSWEHIGILDNFDCGYQGEPYWSYGSSFNGICKTLGEDLSNTNNLYWTNSQWAFGSSNGGVSFESLHTKQISNNWWQSTGFDNVNMMDIAISESNPNEIFLAYFDIGLWRSLDNGTSWQSCNPSIATGEYTGNWEGFGGNVASVLIDPVRENVVWSTMSGYQNGEDPTYLIKSVQNGQKESWNISNSGLLQEEVMGLSIDRLSPINNRILYVTAKGDVYKSIDDGASWFVVLENEGCRFTAVDNFNGDIIYAGGEGGMFRSNDGGNSWNNIGLNEMEGDIDTGFWEWGWSGVFDIKTDYNNENWVYVSVFGYGKGLYRSMNNGDTWEKLLTDNYMRGLAISPNNSDILYATSSSALESGGYDEDSHGVYFSTDGGLNWIMQNEGMSWPFAAQVEVSLNNCVYVGSPGTGFQKAIIPGTTSLNSTKSNYDIDIFPNPITDFVFIDSKEICNLEYKIFDIFGLEVLKGKVNSSKINISKLKDGFYLLNLYDFNLEIIKSIKMIKA